MNPSGFEDLEIACDALKVPIKKIVEYSCRYNKLWSVKIRGLSGYERNKQRVYCGDEYFYLEGHPTAIYKWFNGRGKNIEDATFRAVTRWAPKYKRAAQKYRHMSKVKN
jgi:hypothetical protein